MPTPTTEILATLVSWISSVEADRFLLRFQRVHRAGQVGAGHGEGHVGRSPSCAMFWMIMSTLIGFRQRREDRRDRAGTIGHAGQRDLRLVLVQRDAGDELPFHLRFLDLVLARRSSCRGFLAVGVGSKEDSTWTRTCSFIASPTERV
jgi:hypothetical protein